MLAVTLALARVLAEANSPAPVLSDEAILILKRTDIRVGNGCTGPDAGVGDGGLSDGASDGPSDAGFDGGVDGGVDDGGVDDGGVDDAGDGAVGDPCEEIPGDAITLVMKPYFSQLTTGTRFALLMVTPSRPVVETTAHDIFTQLAEATKPIIKTVEVEVEDPALGRTCGRYDAGCGGGPVYTYPSDWDPPSFGDGGIGDFDGGYSVDQIGPYEVLRANPTTTTELREWLVDLNYVVMPDDIAAVAPYIAKGYTIVALRVALDETPEGQLAPIALTWAGSEIRLPAALGTIGGFPTTVYIAAQARYDLPGARVPFANYLNYVDTGFLTRNEYTFDPTVHEDPVAIENVSFNPVKQEIYTQTVEVRVPVVELDCGCGETSGGDGCSQCAAPGSPRPDWAIVLGAIVFTMVPRRRRRR
jgi:hypothetical protein